MQIIITQGDTRIEFDLKDKGITVSGLEKVSTPRKPYHRHVKRFKFFTPDEDSYIIGNLGRGYGAISKQLNRPYGSVHSRIKILKQKGIILWNTSL